MLKYFVILLASIIFASNAIAAAREIQCSIYDAFDTPQGAMLFHYDDNKKILTLIKTVGDNFVFMDNNSAWISEAVNKPAKNRSNDTNTIWVKHQGQYNWEFKLNRQAGTIQIFQTEVQAFWKGRCRLVDRSNKF